MSYSLTIISINEFTNVFKKDIPNICYTWRISVNDSDLLYDWIVREAFKRVLNFKHDIQDHYRHDVFKCIFDHYSSDLCLLLDDKLRIHKIKFGFRERIKLLIAGDNVIIARGGLIYD